MTLSIVPLVDANWEKRPGPAPLRLLERTGQVAVASDFAEPRIEYLQNLDLRGGRRALARPLKLEVERTEEGRTAVFSPLLMVGGVGSTYEQAVADFVDSLEQLWLEFSNEVASELHSSALELQRKLAPIFR